MTGTAHDVDRRIESIKIFYDPFEGCFTWDRYCYKESSLCVLLEQLGVLRISKNLLPNLLTLWCEASAVCRKQFLHVLEKLSALLERIGARLSIRE